MLRLNANPEHRPTDFLQRREQIRLLVLVASLGLVLIVVQQLNRPQAAAWFDRLLNGGQPSLAVPDAPESDEAGGALPPIDRLRLADVRDNTFFRQQETDAWFHVLGALQGAPRALAAPELTYAQLVSQPAAHRGRPVRVTGAVLRIETVTPAENNRGIDQLFRLIIQPPGGQVWPLTIYCLEPPDAPATGEALNLPIQAVGYFFKNQSYPWSGGVGLTPVVLARSVEVFAPPEEPSVETPPPSIGMILTAAGAVSAVMIVVFFVRTASRRSSPGRALERIVIDLPAGNPDDSESEAT